MQTAASEERREMRGGLRLSWVAVCLLLILFLTAVVRIRLLEVPLERDEGEYAYAGQLILQGEPPYRNVYNMKMPGIYAAYALIEAAFGQTRQAIHLGLLFVNGVTVLLVFLLGRRLHGRAAGIAAAAAYAFLSLGQPVQGVFANAEHFVLPFALGGILLLLRQGPRPALWRIPAAGVLLGTGYLMKQHGAAFAAFAGLYLLLSELLARPVRWKGLAARCLLFLAGVLLPFGLTCLILWRAGVFEKFWFWTFRYARAYASGLPLSDGWHNLKGMTEILVASAPLVWLLAGAGLAALAWNPKARKQSAFAAGFTAFSFAAVCPGLYFRPHYFVFLLPAASLLAGIAVGSLEDLFARFRLARPGRALALLLLAGSIAHGAYAQRSFLFFLDPFMASRIAYGFNPFPESLEIARYVREHTKEEDRIAVIGSEPQIYFYAARRSATGHIYTYALMEDHAFARDMQREMIREIESARPEVLIFVNIPWSWLAGPHSIRDIFVWSEGYRDAFYETAGIIELVSMNRTLYRWNEEARGYTPKSEYWVAVFARKH
jgi:hypothetical protein